MATQSKGNIVRKARTSDTNKASQRAPVKNTEGRTISRVSRKKQDSENGEQQRQSIKYRVSKIEFNIVMFIAITIDIIELILGFTMVGEVPAYVLDVGKVVIIPIWLVMKGISPVKPGRFLRLSVMWIIGFIPFIGSFAPEVALGMWVTLKHARKEDEKGVK